MKKQFISFIAAFSLAFSFCSCEKKQKTVVTDSDTSVSDTSETKENGSKKEKTRYENDESRKIKEFYIRDTNFDAVDFKGVSDVKSNGTDIWALFFSEENTTVCHMDLTGKIVGKDEIKMNGEKKFLDSFISSDGSFYYSVKCKDSGQEKTYFGYVDPVKGNVIISDDFKYDFFDFAADRENIYLHSRSDAGKAEKLVKLDNSGNFVSEVNLFEGNSRLSGDGLFDHEGQIWLLYRDFSENTDTPDKRMIPVEKISDPDESIKVDLPPDEKYLPCSLKDYDFYYFGNTRVFGCKINGDKTEVTKINELLMSETMEFRFSEWTGTIVPIDSQHVFHIGYLDSPSESTVHAFIKADEEYLDDINGRSIVTLGADLEGKGCYKVSDIYEKIRIFNSTQDDCFIMLKDLAFKKQSFETRITEDVDSGTNPDIIFYNMNITDLRKLASQNKFADLKSLIDNDSEINFEDINPSISELCMSDGKMYTLFPEYDLEILSAKNSVLSDNSISPEKFLNLCTDNTGEVLNAMFPDTVPDSLISAYLKDHMDFSGKKSDFDNDEFKTLLNSLKEMNKNNVFLSGDNSLAQKSFSELSAFVFGNFADKSSKYALSLNRFESPFIPNEFEAASGDKMNIINFPSTEVKQLVEPHFGLSVFESCPDKASAWRFIRNYLSDSYQKTLRYPVMKNAIENYVSMMSDTSKKDNYISESYHCTDSNEAKDAAQLYRDIICSPAAINYNYSLSSSFVQRTNLMNIIIDEVNKFLNDKTDVSETASAIQSKVNEYLNS